jgi:hypothetical protein
MFVHKATDSASGERRFYTVREEAIEWLLSLQKQRLLRASRAQTTQSIEEIEVE